MRRARKATRANQKQTHTQSPSTVAAGRNRLSHFGTKAAGGGRVYVDVGTSLVQHMRLNDESVWRAMLGAAEAQVKKKH
jgi:hypothetical protein